MQVEVVGQAQLRFDGGEPVRAASAIAPFGDGWLIAQDDATHAAWRRPGSITAVRAFPSVAGLDTFGSAAGTKHLKPDVEAAVPVGAGAVLLLGSGSSPARRRASMIRLQGARPGFAAADLTPLYAAAAAVLGISDDRLNLEGACLVDGRMRWFQRGNAAAGVASGSVDVDLDALLAAVAGTADIDAVRIGNPLRYDFGSLDGVALAATDAVTLPDGRILLSVAAEDTPNAYDDGPVTGAGLALLDRETVTAVRPLPADVADPPKVEGLALRGSDGAGADLIAVVDADDPDRASTELLLRVRW